MSTKTKSAIKFDPVVLANRTQDAYSYYAFGAAGWLSCAAMLAKRGYDERQAEAILRSKWTRWARDASNETTHEGKTLASWLDRHRYTPTHPEVISLTAESFSP